MKIRLTKLREATPPAADQSLIDYRSYFWRIHESWAVVGSGIGIISFSSAVDLPERCAYRGTRFADRVREDGSCGLPPAKIRGRVG